jgi:probable F420-dependent oxidoreductase
VKFGVGIPTGREGTAYPIPYVRPHEFPTVARRAEELGYYSLWGNDHFTTTNVIAATQSDPPNFYEPLITYASLINVTRDLRFVVSILVLPQREPVLLAKQVATLDALSGGRLMLGVGLGGYREEFEAVNPRLKGANRGQIVDEGIRALRVLFAERRASFEGKYLEFRNVELAPKPAQKPFPIYVSAHGDVSLKRAGRLGDGLIVAALSTEEIVHARQVMGEGAREAGRNPDDISFHFQIWCSFGEDTAAAEEKLKRSQHFRRARARDRHLTDEQQLQKYRDGNLFGNPDDVISQLRVFEQAGVSHIGVVFLGDTMDELLADMQLFAERVMPAFT